MKTFDVVMMDLEKIQPYEKNPRKNASAIGKVAASIREYGFRQPIVVDETLTILAGHTRWLAAQELGLAKVPVHIAKGLKPAQVRAYRLMDNKSAETSEWVNDLLRDELQALQAADFDPALAGFDPAELDSLNAELLKPTLKPLDVQPPPKMAWVLIGVPLVDYAKVNLHIEAIAALEGTLVESTFGNEIGD